MTLVEKCISGVAIFIGGVAVGAVIYDRYCKNETVKKETNSCLREVAKAKMELNEELEKVKEECNKQIDISAKIFGEEMKILLKKKNINQKDNALRNMLEKWSKRVEEEIITHFVEVVKKEVLENGD